MSSKETQEVKIVLNRDQKTASGVWINGVRISNVTDVAVYGNAREIPEVVITIVPNVVTLDSYGANVETVEKHGREEEGI